MDQFGLPPAWTPILRSYTGGLIEACTQLIQLSMDLVGGWLERYMLRDPDMGFTTDADRVETAGRIARPSARMRRTTDSAHTVARFAIRNSPSLASGFVV